MLILSARGGAFEGEGGHVQDRCDLWRGEIIFQEVAQRLRVQHLDVWKSRDHGVGCVLGFDVDLRYLLGCLAVRLHDPVLRRSPRAILREEKAIIAVVLVVVVVFDRFVGAGEEILRALHATAGPVREEGRVVLGGSGSGAGLGLGLALGEVIGDWICFELSHLQTHG